MQKPIKRALVVDDSRSARMSLKKLLGDYDLDISLAASGEEALEYLKKESVDVIFMDHTMPGMDGLEAVSAIKANPRTATIPVMMYTTREGEVYVGQARALGAVGVLPKNVQPHQLFEMLLKLGLVQDRRAKRTDIAADQTEAVPVYDLDGADAQAGVLSDQVLEEQALGISVQTVVSRILEDQHVTLRSDILRSQRAFAKDVAREVLREHYAREAAIEAEDAQEVAAQVAQLPSPRSLSVHRLITGCALVGLVVALFLGWQFKQQRDAAHLQLAGIEASTQALTTEQRTAIREAAESLGEEPATPDAADALLALQWSLNHGNDTAMYEPAFNQRLAAKLEGMFTHLEGLGFRGEIRLTSHLGQFCLDVSDSGTYELVGDDRPAADCAYKGHILDISSFVSERITPEFSRLLDQAPASMEISLVALYATDSQPLVAYPSTSSSARDWNQVAQQNNRVAVELLPANSAGPAG
ncbi:MAG: response regulator [Pseudomonadota bacterium]